MKSNFHPFIILTFLIASCGPDTSPLILKNDNSANHIHIGEGVYMINPPGFSEASSYMGFQAPDYNASISLKPQYESLENLRKEYTPESIKSKPVKLLALKELFFKDVQNGFYVKLEYKGRGIINEILVFENGGSTYKMIGLYHAANESIYGPKVNLALLTSYVGQRQVKEEYFQMAYLDEAKDALVYTRDGKFPTESPDELYLSISTSSSTSKSRQSISNEMKAKIKEAIGNDFKNTNHWGITTMPLKEGKVYATSFSDKGYKVVARAYANDDEPDVMIAIAYGNESVGIDDLKDRVDNMFLTLDLSQY